MKIAFWSNANETCSVSANLAAISVASVIRYPYTIIAMENRLCKNNLGKGFMGRTHDSSMDEVGTNYYEGTGMEGLMRKLYRGEHHQGILDHYLKRIIDKHLYYIPQSRIINNEIFDYELDRCFHPLFKLMEEFADICFIDTASHRSLSTKTILEEADLIVVNLCQKQIILEDFFLNYSSLIPKAIFIISNYNCRSILSSRNIAKTYEVPWENIIIVPQNDIYQAAFLNGDVVEFISRNYSCTKDSPHYIFIQSIKKATYIIIRKAEEMLKQKELQLC